ncbi:MAG: hypothetical protein HYU53_13340 [Acidobacteria bacterium]|nr:hypothetical protein [Acidobacteriota bacterium]
MGTLALLALVCASRDPGQIQLNIPKITIGTPVTIEITNATLSPVEIWIDHRRGGVLGASERKVWKTRAFGNGSTQLVFGGNICAGVTERSTAPVWTADIERWGPGAALHATFLAGTPTESELKTRVDLLKRALDGSKTLGRQRMKRDVDDWFKAVRRSGALFETVCENTRAVVDPYTAYMYLYGGQEQRVNVFIRENHGRYHVTSY